LTASSCKSVSVFFQSSTFQQSAHRRYVADSLRHKQQFPVICDRAHSRGAAAATAGAFLRLYAEDASITRRLKCGQQYSQQYGQR
jgi:hypothetical protein